MRLVHGSARAELRGGRSAAGAALAAALLAVAAMLMGCGDGDDPGAAGLSWSATPELVTPPTLPRDRILRGEVENGSEEDVRIEAERIRVLDQGGRPLRSAATFLSGYIHGLYPPTRGPASYPEAERVRSGKVATLAPGDTVPLTVSWRDPPGARRAARIDYGTGTLPVRP